MMDLSDRSKVLILVGIIGVFVFFFIQNGNSDVTPNEGALQMNKETNNITNNGTNNGANNDMIEEKREEQSVESNDTVEIGSQEMPKNESASMNTNVIKKLKTRNSSKDGQFVYSSYVDGRRGGRSSDLDQFFEDGHPLDKKVGFERNDKSDYASYVPGKRRKMKDVDKFNADTLLPKENNKDWFMDPYESTSVKNTHLINLYRPVGVNTIQTSLKNPSHDIRGTPTNPKYAVSPWMNSSYEPDTNLRNQSLCY